MAAPKRFKDRPPALANRRYQEHAAELTGRPMHELFTQIYCINLWGSQESRSGVGSEHEATQQLQQAIPQLLGSLQARSLLDIPCGDFGWLSRIDLGLERYIGADIVAELVEQNRLRYGQDNSRSFLQLDLTSDSLPAADVVLCRDCLVHFSSAAIFRAFTNLKRSSSRYLLATTFVDLEENEEIPDGDWRPLNLQRPPFSLPQPLALIIEGCSEEGGAYIDKALGLWNIADLPQTPAAGSR